jgi:hypothetical protein
MRKLFILLALGWVTLACEDPDKNPFPDFEEGVSFRAVPAPFTVRPAFSLANISSSSIAYATTSYNADDIEKVDIYVSHLTVAQSNSVGPIPGGAATPVTINYVNYNNLISGATPAVQRVLLRSITEFDGTQTFTAADLAAAYGVATSSILQNQSFILIFEVTKKDGKVFSYANSGPGINGNPAPAAGEGSDFIPGVIIRIGA